MEYKFFLIEIHFVEKFESMAHWSVEGFQQDGLYALYLVIGLFINGSLVLLVERIIKKIILVLKVLKLERVVPIEWLNSETPMLPI